MEIVYSDPSGQRNSVLVDIKWIANNNTKIINLVTDLSELMRERNVDLAKAYELISGGKVSKNGKYEINLQALTDEFLNEERGNRRETTKKDLRKRLDRTLQALSVKPIPRNSEQLRNSTGSFLLKNKKII